LEKQNARPQLNKVTNIQRVSHYSKYIKNNI